MRKIKYRVWNIDRGSMISPDNKEYNNDTEEFLPYFLLTQNGAVLCYDGVEIDDWRSSYIVTEYIGLKDAKGNEIYEGDILANQDSSSLFNWLVEFKDGGFVIVNIGIDGYLGDRFRVDSHTFSDRVVIGNIYKNPELLKGRI